MNRYLLIAALVVVIGALGAAWRISALTDQRNKAQSDLKAEKALSEDYKTKVVTGQTIERTYLEAVKSATAENDQLRADIASGARRVYVKARCPVQPSGASAGIDAGTAELAPADGQLVSDLRAGIKRQEALIAGLREYIRSMRGSR